MGSTQATTSGVLYIVATPIGNLDDISQRAITTLKSVDIILAEDTRHSKPFLQALGIRTELLSLHEYNEEKNLPAIISDLQKGKNFALISDAGTPLISDPGFLIVRKAREQKIQVIPIPGPSALIAALSASGLPCDSFCFRGFLPPKHQARKTELEKAFKSNQTTVFFESTHRLKESIEDIISVYGKEFIWVIAKELTKQFETILYATGAEITAWFLEDKSRIKGEFVLILPPVPLEEITLEKDKQLLSLLLAELPLSKAVKLASQITKKAKNDLYDLALRLS